MTEEPVCELEMAITVWAGSLGTTEQSIGLVLGMMLDEPMNMPYWVSELSRIRKDDENSAEFQKLADAVWTQLPQAIQETQEGIDSALREALKLVTS